jgi:predicted DNA-binding transcriptional regulator AlpA
MTISKTEKAAPLRFLTLDELADLARVSRRSIDRASAQKRGPRLTRIGNRVVVAEADAVAWLRSCADGATAA